MTENKTKLDQHHPDQPIKGRSWLPLIFRGSCGGVLMGLANLVPGISGGTMLLVSGVYEDFIDALSRLSRFRMEIRSLICLCSIGLAALVSVLIFAGLLRDAILENRWIMYSLFIGLTLGGLPVVWKMARPVDLRVIWFTAFAFIMLSSISILKMLGITGSLNEGIAMGFLAGVAGAGAMILPGISGAYLLILLGQYETILMAIDETKNSLQAGSLTDLADPLRVLFPVGLGVVAGVLVVSNLLRWLLSKYKQQTMGVLLGLLLGSVCGLYPFQDAIPPVYGDRIKGMIVTQENIGQFKKKDWLTETRLPKLGEVPIAIMMIGLGFGATMGIARMGDHLKSRG